MCTCNACSGAKIGDWKLDAGYCRCKDGARFEMVVKHDNR